MKRVLDWAADHRVAILITDLADDCGAHYWEKWRQVEVSDDLDPDRRLELLLEIVARATQRCPACRAGLPHTGGRRVVPIGCTPSSSCNCPLAVGV